MPGTHLRCESHGEQIEQKEEGKGRKLPGEAEVPGRELRSGLDFGTDDPGSHTASLLSSISSRCDGPSHIHSGLSILTKHVTFMSVDLRFAIASLFSIWCLPNLKASLN